MDRPEEPTVRERVAARLRPVTATIRSHPRRSIAVALAVVVVSLLIYWAIPTSVATRTPERREVVETLVTTGRVRSESRSQIGAPLSGTFIRVEVEEGDRVSAGELLFALEDAELRAAVAEATARVRSAEAALEGVTEELATALAAMKAAELEAVQLRRDVGRLSDLYQAGGLSLQEFETAQRTAESAEARLASARNRVVSLAPGGAERSAAAAEVQQAREARDAAQARLELTRVRAPAAGTVLIRDVEPGDAAQPGKVLMEIALDGPTGLIVFPDERSVANLKVGQPALASADAFPDQHFHALVSRIAPVVDPEQGSIEVRLAVPDPPSYLIPDMTVSVNVELARRADALTLPLAAVRAPLTDSAWVLVVEGGRATPRPVQVGIRDDRVIEILGGLEPDEVVVAEPAQRVQPGDRVRARRSE